jgi:hypothetical protein
MVHIRFLKIHVFFQKLVLLDGIWMWQCHKPVLPQWIRKAGQKSVLWTTFGRAVCKWVK